MSPLGPLPALLPLVDAALPADDLPRFVLLSADPHDGHPRVTSDPLPDGRTHPAELLLGRRVDRCHAVLGLRVPGLMHELGDPDTASGPPAAPRSAQVLVLVDRQGAMATRILPADGTPTEITESPTGWVADTLLRAVGAPTPPPHESVAECVEAFWLNELAEHLLVHPRPDPDWDLLARCHPLAAASTTLPGVLLAIETQSLSASGDWSRIRRRFGWSPRIPRTWAPTWAAPVSLDQWFDDGSFARWLMASLMPTADLLPAVLDLLPERVGLELLEALTTVELPVLGC